MIIRVTDEDAPVNAHSDVGITYKPIYIYLYKQVCVCVRTRRKAKTFYFNERALFFFSFFLFFLFYLPRGRRLGRIQQNYIIHSTYCGARTRAFLNARRFRWKSNGQFVSTFLYTHTHINIYIYICTQKYTYVGYLPEKFSIIQRMRNARNLFRFALNYRRCTHETDQYFSSGH